MEENNQTTQTKPEGKGMAVAGFVIGLVALVFYVFVATAVVFAAALGGGYGLGIFWLVLALAGTILSAMGMMKLGKTGGKKGLAIAGLVVGLVATVLTLMLVVRIGKIQSEAGTAGKELMKGLESLSDTAKMNQVMREMTDSLKAH